MTLTLCSGAQLMSKLKINVAFACTPPSHCGGMSSSSSPAVALTARLAESRHHPGERWLKAADL